MHLTVKDREGKSNRRSIISNLTQAVTESRCGEEEELHLTGTQGKWKEGKGTKDWTSTSWKIWKARMKIFGVSRYWVGH